LGRNDDGQPQTDHGVNTSQEVLRRRLIGVAAVTVVLATLHFTDHVIRGQLVLDRGLEPAWNHSGWPFQARFSPFTVSLILVYGLLLGGIVLTFGGRVWAGYWLVTAILLGAVVTRVHFVPGPNTESPSVIIDTYGSRVVGITAAIITFAIAATLVVMAAQAIWVRRVTGRW
jgi:hypothetical protein